MTAMTKAALEKRNAELEQTTAELTARVAELEDVKTRLGDRVATLEGDVELDVAPTPEAMLTAALARAQAAFPAIPKSLTATVQTKSGGQYSYKYADLSDVLAAVRPVLSEHGIAIVQRPVRDPGAAGGVILRTELRHTAGGTIDADVDLGQQPGDPQAFGGALTYLRRYVLTALLGIAPDEDSDARTVDASRSPRPPAEAPAPAWARDAAVPRRRELVAALTPLLGAAGAKAIGAAIKDTVGLVPDVAVLVAVLIAEAHAATQAAAAQDAAAEAPDEPAPDEPTPARVDPRTTPDVPLDEALAGLPIEEVYTAAENHPRQDVREAATRELERRSAASLDAPAGPPPTEADVDAQAAQDAPLPGSVEVGELPGDPAIATGVLKAAGCVCPGPLEPEPAYADECPIKGHGIPF